MRVLVTGGAGYIGSHTAMCISEGGHEPVVFDNLSTGHSWAVKWGPLIIGDLTDRRTICAALQEYQIDAVMHFAASAYVGESMKDPGGYFENNITGTLNLLRAMMDAGVKQIVFSSTCATYGVPDTALITEAHPQRPVNPYGESKLFGERALHWYKEIHGFKFATLRYFNAAGADPETQIGEDHDPECHLIPLVIRGVLDRDYVLDVNGTDYPTPDGTPVRDYVHVTDLAKAHLLALEYLSATGQSLTLNLGSGRGVSIKEIIDVVSRHTGFHIRTRNMPRRKGDPAALVADNRLAVESLGWRPLNSGLAHIVETAWKWHASSFNKAHANSVAAASSSRSRR